MHLLKTVHPGNLFFKDALFRIKEKDNKAVYLTFDDGPIPEITPLILDTLQQHHAKATFFCVGENVKKHPDIFQRIINEGHSIGNHTYSHLNGWQTSRIAYMKNISKCSELVQSKLFRPPYGKIKYGQYRQIKKNFRIVFWDVLSKDYDTTKNTTYCFAIIKNNLRAGSIIVFHDNIKAAAKLPALLIETLQFIKKQGFTAESIPPTF